MSTAGLTLSGTALDSAPAPLSAPPAPASTTPDSTPAPVQQPAPSAPSQLTEPETLGTQPQPTGSPSLVRRLALGALMGLAHGGIGGAVVGALEGISSHQFGLAEQGQQDRLAKLHAETQKAQADAATEAQTRQSDIRFKDAASASSFAEAHYKDQQLQGLPQEQADAHDKIVTDIVHSKIGDYGQPMELANHGETVAQVMREMTQRYGHAGEWDIYMTKDRIYAFDMGAIRQNMQADVDAYNEYQQAKLGTNAPAISLQQWRARKPEEQDRLRKEARDFWASSPDETRAQGNSDMYASFLASRSKDHAISPERLQQLKNLSTYYDGLSQHVQHNKEAVSNQEADFRQGIKMEITPAYGFDPQAGKVIQTTMADAQSRGLREVHPVTAQLVRNDQHDVGVMNDVVRRVNNLRDSAKALDDPSQRNIISNALDPANGVQIGFGEHIQLPMDTLVNNWLRSRNLAQANDLTKNYIMDVLSLRETSMGMSRILTGTARNNESQIKALQATLPGYEPDSRTANMWLDKFATNVDKLRKPLPDFESVPKDQFRENPTQSPKHLAGQSANGLPDGTTGKGDDNKPYIVKGGIWVPKQSQ